jgi:hypothetical protein
MDYPERMLFTRQLFAGWALSDKDTRPVCLKESGLIYGSQDTH